MIIARTFLLLVATLSLATLSFALVSPSSALAASSGDALTKEVSKPWFGDFSAMKRDKVVRVLIPYTVTYYYLEKGVEKGVAVEMMREFEKHINKGVKSEGDKIRVILIPVARDQLLSGVNRGLGDLAVGNLTVTSQRKASVDFSDPLFKNVQELIVSQGDVPDITALDALAGLTIHVRPTSSYFSSLETISETLEKQGLAPPVIVPVAENLEDEDLMAMVNEGIIPAIVMDDHKVKLWATLYTDVKIHDGFPIREGGETAWAFRKNSPEMKKVINAFVEQNKPGTLMGNILLKRYFGDINKLINPGTAAYQKKLDDLLGLFEKYGEKYDIDPMLLAAQAFQESRLNNNAKSSVGAVGIMQLMPSTANDRNVGIKNFRELEGNIEAGAKYNRFVADTYFDDPDIPELDKILFVLASYNAGPNRVARVRKKAEDPNKWFGQVEMQVARAAGVEPIRYVKNIYIYYTVFSRLHHYDKQRNANTDK